MDFSGSTILLTGATGTLGTALTHKFLSLGAKVRAYARNEHAHEKLAKTIPQERKVYFSSLIGDVRDYERLKRAGQKATYLIHAAAQKIIPLAEYNPRECLETNVNGTLNVVEAVLDCGVKKAILISTDKASSPSTLYGASKLCAERAWLSANRYCGAWGGTFIAVRYGNVWGSQGSVIQEFMRQKESGKMLVTDPRMTRFHLRLEQAVDLVMKTLEETNPGELFVPKLPSYNILDLAEAVSQETPIEYIGRRSGEKLTESLVSKEESYYAKENTDHFLLTPGVTQQEGGWDYNSSNNQWKLSKEELKEEIKLLLRSHPPVYAA